MSDSALPSSNTSRTSNTPPRPIMTSTPDTLNLRSLFSSKEAGIVIGRGGKNVAHVRDTTSVKAGVSKVVDGVSDRVLTVSGSVESVSKAYSLIAQTLIDNPIAGTAPTTPLSPVNAGTTSLRLLVSHGQMGGLIGKAGAKIKEIQDASGARMVAYKELLPQSTERIVELSGSTEAIRLAVAEIGLVLIEDFQRAQGTVLYHPQSIAPDTLPASSAATSIGGSGSGGGGGVLSATGNYLPHARRARGSVLSNSRNSLHHQNHHANNDKSGNHRHSDNTGRDDEEEDQHHHHSSHNHSSAATHINGSSETTGNNKLNSSNSTSHANGSSESSSPQSERDRVVRTQNISIPSDMVGCIIGKGGSKINFIRKLSGSKISIAKTAHDETGERLFTISGNPTSNEQALYLLYNQLESEKERRQTEQQRRLRKEAAAEATNNSSAATNVTDDSTHDE